MFRSPHMLQPRVRRVFAILLLTTALLLFIAGLLAMLQAEASVHAFGWNRLTNHITPKTLVMVMGENIPYLNVRQKNQQNEQIVSRLIFELLTSLNLRDPRTFLGHELPMFALFDAEIIEASPGVDFTSIPIESPPPPELEKLIRQGSAEQQQREARDIASKQPPRVFIYHTHYWESYLPEIGKSKPDQAVSLHSQKNINQVGRRLTESLKKHGIGTLFSPSQPKVESRYAYRASREKIKRAMANHKQIAYLIDIHRDSRTREKTTITIEGKTYARLSFVVGKSSRYYEQNLQLAKKLYRQLNKEYPGLVTAVIEKPKTQGINGEYNQSLSPNSLLVEVGGVGNRFEEAYRSVDVLAKVLSENVIQAKTVNGRS